jgi:cytochrome c oxidase subunit II
MTGGLHEVLAPAGPQAAALSRLWWLTLGVCALVFIAVMAALAYGVWRAPRATAETAPDVALLERAEPRLRWWVTVGVAVSTVLLLGLLLASLFTDRLLARLPLGNAVHIELTAHQFWWEARYDDVEPSRIFTTANELHVPVGRPVVLTLRSADVIHSFWVPSLHGKKDLIPGRDSTFAIRADRAGVYRGQCAEFCGFQHANMVLYVMADDAAEYERWAAAQRRPATLPESDAARHGMELVVGSTCAMCHTIAGTSAQGRQAPDLTHVATRTTIGAGVLPNNAGTRAAWILNPQAIKPGVNMPPHGLSPQDLHSINAYLATLQ